MAQPNQGQAAHPAAMQGIQIGGGQAVPQVPGLQAVDPQRVKPGSLAGRYTGHPINDGWKQKFRWAFFKFREEGKSVKINDVQVPDPYLPPMVEFPKMYQGPRPSTKFPNAPQHVKFTEMAGGAFLPGQTPEKFTSDHLAPQARETLREYVERHFDLKYRSVLGWGGNGLACLFAGTDSTGKVRQVVAKTALRPGNVSGMLSEADFQQQFEGCEHIVQLEDLSDFTLPSVVPPSPGDPLPGSNPVVATPHVILLEYLPNGSLAQVICNLWHAGTPLPPPNWFLWEMWQCMLRAIHEFEFPDNKYHYDASGLVHFRRMDVPGENNVHFDIDPSNYIVGDQNEGYDDDAHGLVPILKMSDFGLSTKVDKKVLHDPSYMWALRWYGKTFFLTPEQFTEEWDYVTQLPLELLQPSHVAAGKYTWKNNLWQAAQSMVGLITGKYPQLPPVPSKMNFTPHLNGLAADGSAEQEVEVDCYGQYVLELPNWVDPHLKDVLARCMIENPDERPTMREVMEDAINSCEDYEEQGDQLGDHDARDWPKDWWKVPHDDQEWWTEVQLSTWIEEALFTPPPAQQAPPAPPPNVYVQQGQAHALAQHAAQAAKAAAQARKHREFMYKRSRQYDYWFNTRPPKVRERLRNLTQPQLDEVQRKWINQRTEFEGVETYLTGLLQVKQWQDAYNNHFAMRPPQIPPGPYLVWVAGLEDLNKAWPFHHAPHWPRECQKHARAFAEREFLAMIAERDKEVDKYVNRELKRLNDAGLPIVIADIDRIRDTIKARPIQVAAPDIPIRRRIRALQRQIWGWDWHPGRLINTFQHPPVPGGFRSPPATPLEIPMHSPRFTPYSSPVPGQQPGQQPPPPPPGGAPGGQQPPPGQPPQGQQGQQPQQGQQGQQPQQGQQGQQAQQGQQTQQAQQAQNPLNILAAAAAAQQQVAVQRFGNNPPHPVNNPIPPPPGAQQPPPAQPPQGPRGKKRKSPSPLAKAQANKRNANQAAQNQLQQARQTLNQNAAQAAQAAVQQQVQANQQNQVVGGGAAGGLAKKQNDGAADSPEDVVMGGMGLTVSGGEGQFLRGFGAVVQGPFVAGAADPVLYSGPGGSPMDMTL